MSWRGVVGAPLRGRIDRGIARALGFLESSQRPDGAFVPLWFGNQRAPEEENPLYGTSRVLAGLVDWPPGDRERIAPMIARATGWLLDAQNADGSWGGARGVAGSIEETALAVEALARSPADARRGAVERGLAGCKPRQTAAYSSPLRRWDSTSLVSGTARSSIRSSSRPPRVRRSRREAPDSQRLDSRSSPHRPIIGGARDSRDCGVARRLGSGRPPQKHRDRQMAAAARQRDDSCVVVRRAHARREARSTGRSAAGVCGGRPARIRPSRACICRI